MWNTDLRDNLLFLKIPLDNSGNFAPPGSTLTLAAATATPIGNRHAIDTEAAAAADNLNTLTISGSIRDGHWLALYAFNIAHVVTVRDGLGNISLKAGDFALNNAARTLLLQLRGTTWYELARSDQTGALMSPKIQAYSELINTIVAAATTTIDCKYTSTTITLGANITTLAFSNLPASGTRFQMVVKFKQDATGGRTVAWPASVRSPGGVNPTVTATLNKHDTFTLMTDDGGTLWDLFPAGQNIANA